MRSCADITFRHPAKAILLTRFILTSPSKNVTECDTFYSEVNNYFQKVLVFHSTQSPKSAVVYLSYYFPSLGLIYLLFLRFSAFWGMAELDLP